MNVLLLLPSILLLLLEGVSPNSPPSSAAQHGPGAASSGNSTSLRSTEQAAPRQGVRPIFESMRRGLSGSSNSSGKAEAPNTSSIAGSSYGWSSAYRRSNGGEEVVDDQKEMNKDLKKLIQVVFETDLSSVALLKYVKPASKHLTTDMCYLLRRWRRGMWRPGRSSGAS